MAVGVEARTEPAQAQPLGHGEDDVSRIVLLSRKPQNTTLVGRPLEELELDRLRHVVDRGFFEQRERLAVDVVGEVAQTEHAAARAPVRDVR